MGIYRRHLIFVFGFVVNMVPASSFAADPEIDRQCKSFTAQCQSGKLSPNDTIQMCDLAVKFCTLESTIAATNAKNRADAAMGGLILDSVRGR